MRKAELRSTLVLRNDWNSQAGGSSVEKLLISVSTDQVKR